MRIHISRDLAHPLRHTIAIGPHTLAADVSVDEGGEDSAPSPHDLYDAALGACKALTVAWYARRKGIPVEQIEVWVERDASQERAGLYKLATTLSLGGALSDMQRQALLAAAQKCPVHKLMSSVRTEISTELAP
ncbi:OsmC family protein [Massilia sp. TS11]|uniref:OsmC family protein n=1 Tax=Massilia sp. TS11 TaxID=2908003 RepID=UPI001EDAABAC|nr:OsmC family protein [Massilia sp. TS11]MCG2584518.1 OsmC family protein [Massilia sp. TS11]